MSKPSTARQRMQAGLSMIEVLVTLVILLIGLLGLAGLMTQSHRAELESYQRVQALILLQDMAGRINANRKAASCYAISDGTSGQPYLGTDTDLSAAPPACVAGTADQQARAIQDMRDWDALLKGSAEQSGNDKAGAMLGARGCVSFDATTAVYTISVAWQGLGETAAPPDNATCANGRYGDNEKLRRVVNMTMLIADLAA